MIGILIIAHGSLGQSLVECASHVMGSRPPLLDVLAVQGLDEPTAVLRRAEAIVKTLDQGQGVLVLSDMYGATPCNVTARLTQTTQVMAVAGVNLPMLLRALTYRNGDLQHLVNKAISGGREGVVQFDAAEYKKNGET